ncbi:hypothetical protein [Haloterrigena salinisoli]|uniref:hypothetical protein n=1 Tax=Haloterrigena salinisoli TaxID=3132747 RepID=UPI0030D575CA
MKENCLDCAEPTTDNLAVIWNDPDWGKFIFPAREAWIYEPEKVGYFCDSCWESWNEQLQEVKPYLILANNGYKPEICWKKIDQLMSTIPEWYYAKATVLPPEEIQDRLD